MSGLLASAAGVNDGDGGGGDDENGDNVGAVRVMVRVVWGVLVLASGQMAALMVVMMLAARLQGSIAKAKIQESQR
jgi:hypothetical protein